MSTHNQVAHAWAHQTGRQQRGFALSYDGPVIYSWGRHFPIARLLVGNIVLFTTRSRSVSTAKHKSIVRRAASHLETIDVDNVMADTPVEHRANYDSILAAARDAVAKAGRARVHGEHYLRDAQNHVAMANRYAILFLPEIARLEFSDLDSAIAEIARRAEDARAESERRERERRRIETLASRDRLRKWLAGGDVSPPRTFRPYVRVRGNTVQTTWGATVPLADALRVWNLLKQARATKQIITDTARVGDFKLDEVTPLGIRVGCHLIPYCAAKLAADAAGIN